MPLVGNTYVQRERDDILQFLEAELRNEFGENIDLTDSSAFRTFANAISGVDSATIETALSEVHEAAYLDGAEGENLDRLVSILGISRRSATRSTGIVEFRHNGISDAEYPIDNGTVVQTNVDDPTRFETAETVSLSKFDDFESGALRTAYKGQTADFNVVDGSASSEPSATQGNFSLKSFAVDGSTVYDDDVLCSRGSLIAFQNYLQNDTATPAACANLFGVLDADNYYRIRIEASGEHHIEISTSAGGITTLASDTNATIPETEWLRNEIKWEGEENGRIVSQLIDANNVVVSEIKVTSEDEIGEGGFGFSSLDGSENKYWDHSGEYAVQANARAREGGPVGNIAKNTLVVLPSVPSGVNEVTNPFPMGDDKHRLTNTIQFDVGTEEESDEELRDRIQISEGERGEATVLALLANVSSLPQAQSVTIYENKTNDDNTGTGGLPPKSFEVVYYGTDPDQDVADTIFETKGFTARDYGGAHGTAVSETVEADNQQVFTINWTEPNTVSIDMTLDIVVNDEFIGSDCLRDKIVDYVGGTLSDGTTLLGTGVDENIYVDQIEDVVTGPSDTGVIGISSYSFTPSTTTDSNGLEIVDIASNEVGNTNAEDSSITLNITRV